jgi:hypothetical protein
MIKSIKTLIVLVVYVALGSAAIGFTLGIVFGIIKVTFKLVAGVFL